MVRHAQGLAVIQACNANTCSVAGLSIAEIDSLAVFKFYGLQPEGIRQVKLDFLQAHRARIAALVPVALVLNPVLIPQGRTQVLNTSVEAASLPHVSLPVPQSFSA